MQKNYYNLLDNEYQLQYYFDKFLVIVPPAQAFWLKNISPVYDYLKLWGSNWFYLKISIISLHGFK